VPAGCGSIKRATAGCLREPPDWIVAIQPGKIVRLIRADWEFRLTSYSDWLNEAGTEAERNDRIPDVRDGLTREERVVLYVLHETQKERGGRNVPTAMLWGRVCEHFYISPEDLSEMLARLGARK
jgi:hypothetical protein